MGRSAGPSEKIRYHHVEGSGRHLLKNGAGIADPDAHPACLARARPVPARPAPALGQGQPPPDEVGQRDVGLDRQLAGPRPGRRHVPRQGQASCSEVQHAQWLPGRRRQIDQVPEPPHVLELQVLRIIEVNVRLRGSVHQQRPGPGPVRVTDKLNEARIDVLPDDRAATALLPV